MFRAFLVYNIEILIPVPVSPPHFSCGVGASRQTWTASRTARLPHVFLHVPLRFSGLVYSSVDGDNDNDNDTLREVQHLSDEGLALQARVWGS